MALICFNRVSIPTFDYVDNDKYHGKMYALIIRGRNIKIG